MSRPRTFLRVSPLDQSAVREALGSEADAVLLDLAGADGDAERLRREARLILSGRPAGRVWVRINHLETGGAEDCAAVVGPALAGVFLPYVQGPQDVRDLGVVLRKHELRAGVEPGAVRVVACLETARGVLRAQDVAEAAPRMLGLAFDRVRLAEDIDGGTFGFGAKAAAGMVVLIARAFDLLAVEGSALSSDEAPSPFHKIREDGYGAVVITRPGQSGEANRELSPTEEGRDQAKTLLEAFERARAAGDQVARLPGRVVDAYAARRLRRLI